MNKNIVKGIAVILVLCYVSTILTLHFTKIITFNFRNIIDITNVVLPLVLLLIGAVLLLSGKLDKYIEEKKSVSINPEVDYLFNEVKSDLKSLTERPFDEKECERLSSSLHEKHERLKLLEGKPILFHSVFKGCFDSFLNKVIHSGAFNNGLVTYSKLKEVLTKKELLGMVLMSQLIVKNPMLSVLYPKDIIHYIVNLSKISIKDYSIGERRNVARTINRLLTAMVFVATDWKQLSSSIYSAINNEVESNRSLLDEKKSDSYWEKAEHDEKKQVLSGLLSISHLRYYFVTDLDECEKVRMGIKKADDIINVLKKKDPGVLDIVDDIESKGEAFSAIELAECDYTVYDSCIIIPTFVRTSVTTRDNTRTTLQR